MLPRLLPRNTKRNRFAGFPYLRDLHSCKRIPFSKEPSCHSHPWLGQALKAWALDSTASQSIALPPTPTQPKPPLNMCNGSTPPSPPLTNQPPREWPDPLRETPPGPDPD